MIPIKNRFLIFRNELQTISKATKKNLRIIHFNDVYNIEPSDEEPLGGAARFKTVLDYLQAEGPTLLVFSGDAFSPSKISLYAKGEQMVKVLNLFNIHAACIGNHEFDMGLDTLEYLIDKCTFPWLLSNVLDAHTHKPLGGAKESRVVVIGGVKVGLIGLAEKEWVKSLAYINYDDMIYESFIHEAAKLAKELRKRDKVDIVIAVTHMRWNNDEKLAKKVHGVDLILGGHDHDYETRQVDGRWIIKSGTDFKECSIINVSIDKRVTVEKIERILVDSKIPEDKIIKEISDDYLSIINDALGRRIGTINIDLEGRTEVIRIQETNLGNFFCDIMLCGTTADCGLLNSGMFRSDRVHLKGDFLLRDLQDILSFDTEICVVDITGKQLHQVLENGVAKYNEGGGRFPQVSGIYFPFDPSKNPGKRINIKLVKVKGEYLIEDKVYSMATNNFMKNVDEVLRVCPKRAQEENTPVLHILIDNYFAAIQKIILKENAAKYIPSVVPNYVSLGMIKDVNDTMGIIFRAGLILSQVHKKREKKLKFKMIAKVVCTALKHQKMCYFRKNIECIRNSEEFKEKMNSYLEKPLKLAPDVEGRSVFIKNKEEYQNLLNERQLHDVELKSEKSISEPDGIQSNGKSMWMIMS